MKTKRLHLFFLFFLSVSVNLTAQDYMQQFKQKMDNVFSNVDKNKITSGLLSDYALELVDLESYNGTLGKDNYVGPEIWMDLYSSIYTAKINNKISLSTPESVAKSFKAMTYPAYPTAKVLEIMLYEYDKLDDDALTKGWLKYENEKIYEVAGKPSPYIKRRMFAIAPQETVFESNSATFIFSSNLRYSNNLLTTTIELAYSTDNGKQYNKVSFNQPFTASYSTSGEKTIIFRVKLPTGEQYYSQTKILVGHSSELRKKPESKTDQQVNIASSSKHSGGTIQIKYASGNTSKKIKKPLIMASPFDASHILEDIPSFTLDFILADKFESVSTIIDDILGYDIVYLNYKKGTDDILRNAALFKEVIQYVNKNKDSNVKNPNVVVGMGMGGLVARYALSSMEKEGTDHETWKYISLDAPHTGANVPVGMQAFIRHLEGFNLNIFFINVWDATKKESKLKKIYEILDSKAAQQMLIYYCDKNMKINNSVHTSFMSEYNKLGFPQNCQNIATSNGTDAGTSLFAAGSRMMEVRESFSFSWWESVVIGILGLGSNYRQLFLNVLPGNSTIKADININALPNKASQTIYDGKVYLRKKLFWSVNINIQLEHKKVSSLNTMLPLDGAPGSYTSIETLAGDKNLLEGIDIKYNQKNFCLIPTVSAAGISEWNTYLTTNIRDKDLFSLGLTEFENIEFSTTNKSHDNFQDIITFLGEHLVVPAIRFKNVQKQFAGSQQITLQNYNNTDVSWSTTGAITLSNPTKTSATVTGTQRNGDGILSASTTLTLPIALQALLKKSKITTVHKRKMKSLTDLTIEGSFSYDNVRNTFRIKNLPTGSTITWSLSNTSDFKVISSKADSIVIEYLTYESGVTLNAKVNINGTIINTSREMSAPPLSFASDSYFHFIDCS